MMKPDSRFLPVVITDASNVNKIFWKAEYQSIIADQEWWAAQRIKNYTSQPIWLLYVAPETLKKDETIDLLKQVKISFVAVDEAHCISEWGHDVRPEYRRIKQMVKSIDDVPVMALTATATPKVQQDVQKNLGMMSSNLFKSSFNRSNLFYQVRPKGRKDIVHKEIISFIKARPNKSGIVYCLSRKKVEEISEMLNMNGMARTTTEQDQTVVFAVRNLNRREILQSI